MADCLCLLMRALRASVLASVFVIERVGVCVLSLCVGVFAHGSVCR